MTIADYLKPSSLVGFLASVYYSISSLSTIEPGFSVLFSPVVYSSCMSLMEWVIRRCLSSRSVLLSRSRDGSRMFLTATFLFIKKFLDLRDSPSIS